MDLVETSAAERPRWFSTTRWSVVLRVGDDTAESRQALEQLCRLYWYPIYTFARRTGHSTEEAEDLTQGFFVQLLERRSLQRISRVGGKFRSFLLVAFKNYVSNEAEKRRAQKRGGGRAHLALEEPECAALLDESLRDGLAPDRLFDRAWALLVLERAHAALRTVYEDDHRLTLHRKLVQFLPGETPTQSQIEAAEELKMTAGAFRMELLRFKRRFAETIRREVAETVGNTADVDDEVRSLMAAFAA